MIVKPADGVPSVGRAVDSLLLSTLASVVIAPSLVLRPVALVSETDCLAFDGLGLRKTYVRANMLMWAILYQHADE